MRRMRLRPRCGRGFRPLPTSTAGGRHGLERPARGQREDARVRLVSGAGGRRARSFAVRSLAAPRHLPISCFERVTRRRKPTVEIIRAGGSSRSAERPSIVSELRVSGSLHMRRAYIRRCGRPPLGRNGDVVFRCRTPQPGKITDLGRHLQNSTRKQSRVFCCRNGNIRIVNRAIAI